MVAREKDVQTKIKGRRARTSLTPISGMPAVPFRSKAKRACIGVSPIGAVPASPPSQDRAGQSRTGTLGTPAGADPSLSLPAGHCSADIHAACARREATLSGTEGQKNIDSHHRAADGSAFSESSAKFPLSPKCLVPDSPLSDDGAAYTSLTPPRDVPSPSSSILVIRELSRQRTDLLRAWQRLNNQIKAIERRGHMPLDAHRAGAAPSIADSAAPALVHCVDTTWAARKAVEKQLEKLAKSLPVYATFTKPTKGLGAGGLALIIGETGDLSRYANPAKVWKRMGLAVFNGERQRRVAGNAEEAMRQGYSSHRRQIMWNIGDAMIKVGDTYRQVYLDRKAYELAKTPDAKPIVHHRRAQRYMEKRILRDMWRAWRDLHGVAA